MKVVLLLGLGLTIGGLSGLLGIGGGVLLLPSLVWFFGMKHSEAAGITLAVLAVPVALPSVWRYYQERMINGDHLLMAAWIAVAFAVGGYLGASARVHVPDSPLRVGLGLVMIYVAVRFMVQAESTVAAAAAGGAAMMVALLAYFGLRVLGRRHLSRPNLGPYIQAAKQQGRGEIEYHI